MSGMFFVDRGIEIVSAIGTHVGEKGGCCSGKEEARRLGEATVIKPLRGGMRRSLGGGRKSGRAAG